MYSNEFYNESNFKGLSLLALSLSLLVYKSELCHRSAIVRPLKAEMQIESFLLHHLTRRNQPQLFYYSPVASKQTLRGRDHQDQRIIKNKTVATSDRARRPLLCAA
jgi:hypothetical protein